MMKPLRITTLGSLSIHLGDGPVAGFVSRKVDALLVYLAASPDEHSREKLASLLWTSYSPDRANANLRTALSNLRQVVGPYVNLSSDKVSINPDYEYWLDTTEVTTILSNTHLSANRRSSLSANDANQLDQALALYQGDFLAGFYVKTGAEFENWMLEKQRFLREQVMGGMSLLLDYYMEQGEYHRGIPIAKRLLSLDPLNEPNLQQLMCLHALAGNRNAALRQYHETCAELLSELGEEPNVTTTVLYERIRDGLVSAERQSPSVSHNLPPLRAGSVDRSTEIATVANLLDNPEHRVIAITGMAGVGKTHFAIQVAYNHLHKFSEGVFLLPLSAATRANSIVEAITSDRHLEGGGRLLILDGLEQVTDSMKLISEVLATAPEVKILVTSQIDFDAVDATFILESLAVPEFEDDVDLSAYPSVQLFLQTARRIKPDFNLDMDQYAVARICRLTGGLPLAIELAAGLLRIMTAKSIASQLADNLDLLATANRDVSPRHQRITSALDSTWSLYSPQEQAYLLYLADSLDDAVSLPSVALRSLMVKHWLRQDISGGLTLHPIVELYLHQKRQSWAVASPTIISLNLIAQVSC